MQGNLGKLRSMPLVAGGIGILGTLVNRLMSGVCDWHNKKRNSKTIFFQIPVVYVLLQQ